MPTATGMVVNNHRYYHYRHHLSLYKTGGQFIFHSDSPAQQFETSQILRENMICLIEGRNSLTPMPFFPIILHLRPEFTPK